MEPHISQFKMYAAAFAGETGLTMDDLGFATENPSSAEAIKASHETLRLTARKAQRTFGSGFMNVGYLAACLRDDAAIKINQAVPGYFDKDSLEQLIGVRAGAEAGNGDTKE